MFFVFITPKPQKKTHHTRSIANRTCKNPQYNQTCIHTKRMRTMVAFIKRHYFRGPANWLEISNFTAELSAHKTKRVERWKIGRRIALGVYIYIDIKVFWIDSRGGVLKCNESGTVSITWAIIILINAFVFFLVVAGVVFLCWLENCDNGYCVKWWVLFFRSGLDRINGVSIEKWYSFKVFLFRVKCWQIE